MIITGRQSTSEVRFIANFSYPPGDLSAHRESRESEVCEEGGRDLNATQLPEYLSKLLTLLATAYRADTGS